MRLFVAENAPHRARQRRVLQGDLSQNAIVAGAVRPHPTVLGDVLGSQRQHDQLVDAGKVFHELPGVFSAAETFVDEDGELIRGFCPQQLEAGAAARAVVVRGHRSRLRRTPDTGLAGPTVSAYAERGMSLCSAGVAVLTEHGEDAIEILNGREIDADLAFSCCQ